ncbi:MAG TPA: hypothetical protein VHS27_09310 [Gaiellales bacterium]|jgi:hypothetical protein|nr:hypothetical protein [Gaiellales bacterium]
MSTRRVTAGITVLCALVAVAGWAWLESTRPGDPLIFSEGLGFEGPGRTGGASRTADRLRRLATHGRAGHRDPRTHLSRYLRPIAVIISTTKRGCFGFAASNTGVYRSP